MKSFPWKGILIVLATLIFAYYVPEAPRTVGKVFDDMRLAALNRM